MNPIENAKSYLADHGHSSWGREHTRKMVVDLLAVAEQNQSATQFKSQLQWEGLNARMADIREEGPGLVQRIKNWWAGR